MSEFHAEAPQTIASEEFAQGPYVAARAGFEPATLGTKGAESTNAPLRPTMRHHAPPLHYPVITTSFIQSFHLIHPSFIHSIHSFPSSFILSFIYPSNNSSIHPSDLNIRPSFHPSVPDRCEGDHTFAGGRGLFRSSLRTDVGAAPTGLSPSSMPTSAPLSASGSERRRRSPWEPEP